MGVAISLEVAREDDLVFPPEILEEITKDLSLRDMLVSRGVCRGWKQYIDATIQAKYHDNIVFPVEDTEERSLELLTSDNPFLWTNFTYRNILMTRHSLDFWSQLGDRITRLDFYDCTFPSLDLDRPDFGSLCPSLQYLGIRDCGKYLMFGKTHFCLHRMFDLSNLVELNLSQNTYLTDYALTVLLKKTTKLKVLNLSDNRITFTKAVFNRFYPSLSGDSAGESVADDFEFSDYVLTFHALFVAFLSTPRSSKLECIDLSGTGIDGNSLNLITDTETFSWRSLSLNSCSEVRGRIHDLLARQTRLERLELGKGRGDFSRFALEYPDVKKLQHLVLRENMELSSGAFIGEFGELVHLDLSYCTGMPFTTLEIPSKNKLKFLFMRGIFPTNALANLSEATQKLHDLSTKLSNLKVLDLGLCNNLITDEVLHNIIKSCRYLEELRLCGAKITDYGTAGVHNSVRMRSRPWPFPISDSDAPTSIDLGLHKLSYLRILSLSNCRDLGDCTWATGLKLPGLIYLDISSCSQISIAGFEAIFANCRSLEKINCLHCGQHITGNQTLLQKIKLTSPRLRKMLL